MASGRMFGKPMAMEEYFLDIVFEGIVQSSDCAKLIIELLKYIAYQRQQIPLSFDQLKKDVLQDDLVGDQVGDISTLCAVSVVAAI